MTWLRDLIAKVIRVDGTEMVDRRALHLEAGPGVTLEAQDRPAQHETRVKISMDGVGGENGQYQGQLWAWDDDAQRWAPAPPGVQVGGGAGTSDRPILILDAGTDPDLGVRTAGLWFLQEGTIRAELECVGSNGAVTLNLYDADGQLIRPAWIATASNFQILSSMIVAGSIFPSGENWDIGAYNAPWRRIYAKGSYHDIRTVSVAPGESAVIASRKVTDRTIVVDASLGDVTVNLGTPIDAENNGQIITVCRIDEGESNASITGSLVDGTLPAVGSIVLSPGDRKTFQADVQAGYWLRIG